MSKTLCCKRCGSTETKIEVMPEGFMHYSKINCADCGGFITWGKKPDNENKRTDKNEKWKRYHRDQNGQFECAWCGVDERIFSDNLGWRFQLDHIRPLYKGGKDEFFNTQILCFVCHDDKTKRMAQVDAIVKKFVEGGDPVEQHADSNIRSNDDVQQDTCPPW